MIGINIDDNETYAEKCFKEADKSQLACGSGGFISQKRWFYYTYSIR